MRRVFFSFDYDDVWRANVVRNAWAIQPSERAAFGFIDAADRESLKRQGDEAIARWIKNQMHGTSVTVVLIGEDTADSRWVRFEIHETRENNKGLLGIRIHQIKDREGNISSKGRVPNCECPDEYPVYDWDDDGRDNIAAWIEKAAKDAGY